MIEHKNVIKRVCLKCNGFLKLVSPPHAKELKYVCENNSTGEEDAHDVSETFDRIFRCFNCSDGRLELIGWGQDPKKPSSKEYIYRCDLCLTLKIYDERLSSYDD